MLPLARAVAFPEKTVQPQSSAIERPGWRSSSRSGRFREGYWLIRRPASATFPTVAAFVRSGQAKATITPSAPRWLCASLANRREKSPAFDTTDPKPAGPPPLDFQKTR